MFVWISTCKASSHLPSHRASRVMLQATTASRVACCGLQHTPCYVIQQHGKQYTYREPRDTVPYSMAMQSYIDNIPVDQHCIPQSSVSLTHQVYHVMLHLCLLCLAWFATMLLHCLS